MTDVRVRGDNPVAVVDIGSNTIRLVVYEALTRAPTPLFQEKIMAGLGRNLSSTQRLNPNTIEPALSALRRFRKLAQVCGVRDGDLHPFATAAVRWALDGPQFLTRAGEACGVPIQTIGNAEEAELGATGILAGFTSPAGVAGDLGGGSLELIQLRNAQFSTPVSLPLGGLTLVERTKGEKTETIPLIENALTPLAWLAQNRGETFYAIGGTWRALAKLHMRQTGYPLSVVHGYRMDQRKALQVTSRYANSSPAALSRMDGMAAGREETLPSGALLLNAIVRQMQPSAVVFSAFGVREGYLYRMMSEAERRRDPLLSACEDVARLRSRSIEHANELIPWTGRIFESPGPAETADEARLRHAACLLSDIAWRAHPDYRGEQSAALIAQSAFVGVDHPGRAFLALSVYHRYERKLSGELLPKLAQFLSRATAKRALVLGQAIRLAQTLSAGTAGTLPHTPLSYDGGRLILHIPKSLETLDGDIVRRRLRTVARELTVPFDVQAAAPQGETRSSLFRSLIGRSSGDAS